MTTVIDSDAATSLSVDLSSFPLLRIDELPLHSLDTLTRSQNELGDMTSRDNTHDEEVINSNSDPLVEYASKLLVLIQKEVARRRVLTLLSQNGVSIPIGNSSGGGVECDADDCNNGSVKPYSPTRICNDGGRKNGMDTIILQETDGVEPNLQADKRVKPPSTVTCSKTATLKLSHTPPSRSKHQEAATRKHTQNSSSNNYVVASNNIGRNGSNRRGGFRSRAAAATASIKARNEFNLNPGQHKLRAMEDEKKQRRAETLSRMRERSRRRKEMKERAERIERRQLQKKKEKEREYKARMDKVHLDMERAAKMAKKESAHAADLIAKLNPNTDMYDGDQVPEEVQLRQNIVAAIAATEALEAASVNVMDSDSGSSVDSHMNEGSYEKSFLECHTNDEDDCVRLTNLTVEETKLEDPETDNTESVICGVYKKNSVLPLVIKFAVGKQEDSFPILNESRNEKDKSDQNESTCLSPAKQICKTAQKDQIEVTGALNDAFPKQALINLSSREKLLTEDLNEETSFLLQNDCSLRGISKDCSVSLATSTIEWQPWSPVKSTEEELASPHSKRTTKDYIFTKQFPSFSSLFTALVSVDNKKIQSDDSLSRERECLNHQIRSFSSLMEMEELENCDKSTDYSIVSGVADPGAMLFRTKSNRPEVSAIVSDVMLNQEVEWNDISCEPNLDCWNLLWTWNKPKFNPEYLLVFQRISRFQNTSSLTRKDNLKKQLERQCSICTRNHSKNSRTIMPQTFVLPNEYTGFVSAFSAIQKESKDNMLNFWMLKPIGSSRGRGITLINDIGQVSYSSPSVIQRYIMNPLLYQEYKFDFRLYVLVTSFTPLKAFIYKEGFARFGSRKFTLSGHRNNDYLDQIHLTNSSIQKKYDELIDNSHPAKAAGIDGGGNKVKLTWLFRQLEGGDVNVGIIWRKIKELCVTTLESVCGEIPSQPNSFEVFGFDVILDESKRPWLLEVNACPALARDTDLDIIVKEKLVEDTIRMINPCRYDRKALSQICERRLHFKKRTSSARKKISVSERDELEEDLARIFLDCLPRSTLSKEQSHENNGYEILI